MENYFDNLLDDFLSESAEKLELLNNSLMALEKNPENEESINSVFRLAHTLKGDSSVMGLDKIQQINHKMEDVFHMIRNKELSVTPQIIDVFLGTCDFLRDLLPTITTEEYKKVDISHVINLLDKLMPEGTSDQPDDTPDRDEPATESEEVIEIPELSADSLEKIQEARDENKNIFQGKVIIKKDTPMVSLIVYMLFTKLENLGEIIWSEPAPKDAEDYEGQIVSFVIVSSKSKNKIKSVLQVPESKKVIISVFSKKIESKQNTSREEPRETPKPKAQKKAKKKKQPDDESKKEVTSKQKEQNPLLTSGIFKSLTANLRVDPERVDSLLNLVGELVINRSRFSQVLTDLKNDNQKVPFYADLKDTVTELKQISNDLQEGIMQLRMIKIEQIFSKFPRQIRDISRKMNKKIDLEISGEDTELDKRVIEEIKDPMLHIIRNCVDHGIETPAERKKQGKKERSILKLDAYHEGNQITIKVQDDGKGLDIEKIKQKAVEVGIISEDEAQSLSDQEAKNLIFKPGFSTKKDINEISGRGVGMDVVKKNVERLNGSIKIDSTKGKGTTFEIKIPLTLAIIPTLLVKVSACTHAIPLSMVTEIIEITKKDIKLANGNEMITLRNKVIPLIRLKNYFHPELPYEEIELSDVAIINIGENLVGLIVDEFLGEQEIVIKSLNSKLTETAGVSGASILGDGTIALILDVAKVIRQSIEFTSAESEELTYHK